MGYNLFNSLIMKNVFIQIAVLSIFTSCNFTLERNDGSTFNKNSFNNDWKFHLGDIENGEDPNLDDERWRTLNVPHDWSIEGEFSPDHPATTGGGALPGGVGWYRKTFYVSHEDSSKMHFIDFDGVYMNGEVWVNGNYLGKRPNGYISYGYELSPYLNYESENIIAVKVSNDPQPNSRWYSGSGIYRNVWMTSLHPIHIMRNRTFITTPEISDKKATVVISTVLENSLKDTKEVMVSVEILDKNQKRILKYESDDEISLSGTENFTTEISVPNPELWSVHQPNLYKAIIRLYHSDELIDKEETTFGIRSFQFHPTNGFSLNGQPLKIKGVCNHHDLGCLGAAVNKRAIQRQLEIMRGMGVNAIRTAHNPPAPELLELCDEMGFIVMDEAFDIWDKSKSEFDYGNYWDEWHERDLKDLIYRDRNHPSVLIWSIGNEILEQWDSTGIPITKELVDIVYSLDTTRVITTGNNPPGPNNNITKADAFDLIGFNYHHQQYEGFPEDFPGKCFIATETTSALATRGHYDMPSDTTKRWPIRWDREFTEGNPDNTVSAFDHISTPWGSTHEETWKIIKKHDYLSGMFIWTGFDYLGEPTPYSWPSRSSYFGVVDLAGFPKDSYYMYKSEWTDKPVLHIFPHWNWEPGHEIDIWAYTNEDSVELFINNESKGIKKKQGDDLHVWWRVNFEEGNARAVGYKDGESHLERVIYTAGDPSEIILSADRSIIDADGKDLSFITVSVHDENGVLHPIADNMIEFELTGPGKIVGVDNGDPTSHLSLKSDKMKIFHGYCLVVIQSTSESGQIVLTAKSRGLQTGTVTVESK